MTDMTAQELANALGTVLRPQDPLSTAQVQVALQYRLIRNGLGNYGGHGDAGGDVALIPMTQTVLHDRISLTFQAALPDSASKFQVYGGTILKLLDTIEIDRGKQSYWVCEHRAHVLPIKRVVVVDQVGAPIAAGVPVNAEIPMIEMTQRVANNQISRLTFEDALPDGASHLTLHVRTPKQEFLQTINNIVPQDRNYLLVDNTDEVERIEHVDVLDQTGAPIAAGKPAVERRGR
jgi:hypothetical protein